MVMARGSVGDCVNTVCNSYKGDFGAEVRILIDLSENRIFRPPQYFTVASKRNGGLYSFLVRRLRVCIATSEKIFLLSIVFRACAVSVRISVRPIIGCLLYVAS